MNLKLFLDVYRYSLVCSLIFFSKVKINDRGTMGSNMDTRPCLRLCPQSKSMLISREYVARGYLENIQTYKETQTYV